MKIHDPRIVVVLTGEKGARKVCRVDVGERMGAGVPPPETEVESADAGEMVVDYDDLPKKTKKKRMVRTGGRRSWIGMDLLVV